MKNLFLIPLIFAANSAVAESETVIPLKGPNGGVSQLVYEHGSGWKHIAEAAPDSHESDIARQSMGAAQSPQSLTSATSTEDPPAVFIDGPTGYVFIWTQDSGWKFVGRIH